MGKYSLFHKINAFLTCFPKENGIKNLWYSYNWVKKKLIPLNQKYKCPLAKVERANNTIWIYWNSGEDNAPQLVKKCILQARKMCPVGYQVIVLTFDELSNYVELPNFIYEKRTKGLIKEAQFSDILRTTLLVQYGGFWMDATCYLSGDIPKYILDAPFFMFSTSRLYDQEVSPVKGSNWFIKAEINNELLVRTRDLILQYWENNDKMLHYFIFHLILSALVECEDGCKTIWNEKPYVCNMNPHVLQFSLGQSYKESRWEQLTNSCFIHKLTYKFDEKLMQDRGNILSHLLSL